MFKRKLFVKKPLSVNNNNNNQFMIACAFKLLKLIKLVKYKSNYINQTVKMSSIGHPRRYFINTMPDYSGNLNDIKDDDFNYANKIDELTKLIYDNYKKIDPQGGPYVGVSGVAYMFWYLSEQKWLFDDGKRNDYLNKAKILIDIAIKNTKYNDIIERTAYLLGDAGTIMIATLIFKSLNDVNRRDYFLNEYAKLAQYCLHETYLPKGCDELLVGRAGYVCGALILDKLFAYSKLIPSQILQNAGISTMRSGKSYSNKYKCKCPLMYSYYDTEYLGAAHGLAGILQGLLQTPRIDKLDPSFGPDIKASVDYLLSLQLPSGNFPCATDELGHNSRPPDEELVHWCHGAPGVVWLMAKAYLIWKEDKYLDSCQKCGDLVWSKGLLRKGPGICHGIAGNGYVFLLLYRLTNDPKYLYRARQFAKFMFTKDFKEKSRTPDNPFSLFEGWPGTVCYLVDLMNPNQAQFPLYFDIFLDIDKDIFPKQSTHDS